MIDSRPGSSLLDAYVADLERRLASADPGERADIVASVREHVEADLAGLGRPATAADVQASLETLGSVDTVAAAWAPDGAAPAAASDRAPAPAPASPPAPLTTRGRAILAVAVVAGIALAVVFPLAWLLLPPAALVLGIVGARRHPGHRTPYVVTAVLGGVLLALSAVIAPLLLVMTLTSPVSSVDEAPTVQVENVAPAG